MKSSVLEKYGVRPPAPGSPGSASGPGSISRLETESDWSAEIEATDDLGAFGWLRGIKERAITLELRKKTGNILAIGYGWIEKAEFDPSEGITLYALGQKIRIKGRNLNAEVRPLVRLFEGICRQRVPWIQESPRADQFEEGKAGAVIESIEG